MSTITKEDIGHIAKLARVQLTKEEENKMASEMAGILTYIEKLKEVDTTGVEPTAQITGLENAFRNDEDNHESGVWTEKMLAQAPDRKGSYIKTIETMKEGKGK